jgi:Flp pilus assembly pilin Flp
MLFLADARGQTAAEYLGLLLLVAAIVAALLWTGPGQAIADELTDMVRDIAGEQ